MAKFVERSDKRSKTNDHAKDFIISSTYRKGEGMQFLIPNTLIHQNMPRNKEPNDLPKEEQDMHF